MFVYGIGAPLSDGKKHDERAPDYDDWSTQTENFGTGLNGDLLVWSPKLQKAIGLAQWAYVLMQRRLKTLELTEQTDRLKLAWHQRLTAGELPLTIGGGMDSLSGDVTFTSGPYCTSAMRCMATRHPRSTLIRI